MIKKTCPIIKVQNFTIENISSISYSFFTKELQIHKNNINDSVTDTECNSMIKILEISKPNLSYFERQRFKKFLEDDCVPRKEIELDHSIKSYKSYLHSTRMIR